MSAKPARPIERVFLAPSGVVAMLADGDVAQLSHMSRVELLRIGSIVGVTWPRRHTDLSNDEMISCIIGTVTAENPGPFFPTSKPAVAPKPVKPTPVVLCRHCGDAIEPDDEHEWRHSDGLFYFCDNGNGDTLAEPPETIIPTDEETMPTATIDQPETKPVAPKPAGSLDAIIQGIVAETVMTMQLASVDEVKVRSIVNDALKNVKPKLITINSKPPVKLEERTHQLFETVLPFVVQGKNVWLTGPAGSGKTTLAKQVAEAVSVPFMFMSCHPMMGTHELAGYYEQGTGTYRGSRFETAYRDGGLFLLDECDAGTPEVMVWLNAAIANGHCAFTSGVAERHGDFRLMAAGNTWGTGADAVYVGRNELDGATLNRFAKFSMGYDEALETAVTADINPVDGPRWVAKVQAWRHAVADLKEHVLITPRASFEGADMLAQGVAEKVVADAYVWNGIEKPVCDRIISKAGVK